MFNKLMFRFTIACFAFLPLQANAALESRLGGLAFYDTVANLTWSQDASIFTPTNWADTKNAIDNVVIGNIPNWRLPTYDPNCLNSTVCNTSELGNMFTLLGGVAGQSLSTTHNANYDLFTGIISFYWTQDEYPSTNGFSYSWEHAFWSVHAGKQAIHNQADSRGGWAVKTGDVTQTVIIPPPPSSVPVPAAIWLFGSGLIGLIGVARRKKA